MQFLYSWFRSHPMVSDTLWAVLLFLLSMPEAISQGSLGQVLLALALCTLVAIRRRHPNFALWAAAAVAFVQLAYGHNIHASDLALLVIGYGAAAFGKPWTARAALALGFVSGPLAFIAFGDTSLNRPQDVVFSLVASTPFVLAWLLGRFTSIRRAYYLELEDRAARLERERDAQSKVAVAAERARIARELHDVVAHNVSVMIVQADGASYVMDASPEQAKEALGTIAATGRQALAEMRRLLGLLRSEESTGEYVPQPGVEQLPDLLEQVRSAGLPVAFTVEGEPRPLPRGVELTAYRIVQEALTNARKHGGPAASATVRIRFQDSDLAMLIEDDGRGASAELVHAGGEDGFGHGLIGMRERVGMVGGSLDAGPRAGGGFRIEAVLPLGSAR
ncbi:sensor histidine kinase [Streptacidiphilus neutrinimicus]|uniref:sensor histidine kinase n=1 Tax=Streptacidiphilus neutrinimicus TaxID=105420 RepID=UPI0005A92E0D|nr:sensor histidine kinase [Streptacidiphilus neutrinimicus]